MEKQKMKTKKMEKQNEKQKEKQTDAYTEQISDFNDAYNEENIKEIMSEIDRDRIIAELTNVLIFKNKIVPVDHSLSKVGMTYVFKDNNFIYTFRKAIIPNVISYGIESLTNDAMHCLLIDYDNTSIDLIKSELENIPKYYQSGDYFILETSKNHYAVVNLCKWTYREAMDLLSTLHCDQNIIKAMEKLPSKSLTLRFSEKYYIRGITKVDESKPKYIAKVSYPYNREYSTMHYKFFKSIMNIPDIFSFMGDKSKTLKAKTYYHNSKKQIGD